MQPHRVLRSSSQRSEACVAMQEAELLVVGAAGKVLEVDEWEDAQVAAREQVARAKLDSCLEACRLVGLIQDRAGHSALSARTWGSPGNARLYKCICSKVTEGAAAGSHADLSLNDMAIVRLHLLCKATLPDWRLF